jgi:hypothetical protein
MYSDWSVGGHSANRSSPFEEGKGAQTSDLLHTDLNANASTFAAKPLMLYPLRQILTPGDETKTSVQGTNEPPKWKDSPQMKLYLRNSYLCECVSRRPQPKLDVQWSQ